MFRTIIQGTQFTSPEANEAFGNVSAYTYNGDASLATTMRCLLSNRIPAGETIVAYYDNPFLGRSVSELSSSHSAFAWFVRQMAVGITASNSVIIVNVRRSDFMEAIERNFLDSYDGFTRVEKVTEFFIKSFKALCYINHDTKTAVVFVESVDIRKWHYLQCAVVAFLPWYFNPEEGLSAEEMALVQSLRSRSSAEYLNAVSALAEKYDFRTLKIKKLLSGFETRLDRRERDDAISNISYYDNQIRDYNSRISDALRSRRGQEIRLLGLEAKIAQAEDSSEIMDYFLHNKRLFINSVTDSNISFAVKGVLAYFDPDMADNIFKNSNSYVYRPNGRSCESIIPSEDMKKLMMAIFVEQTLKMRVCAAYKFDLSGNVHGIQNYNYDENFRDCTPNAHIDRIECLGKHVRYINEMLKEYNYIGAIEQCISSCNSLNFADSTVMSEFMRRLYGIAENQNRINLNCIELPDGNIVSPKQAIEWLKAQEQEGATNE